MDNGIKYVEQLKHSSGEDLAVESHKNTRQAETVGQGSLTLENGAFLHLSLEKTLSRPP